MRFRFFGAAAIVLLLNSCQATLPLVTDVAPEPIVVLVPTMTITLRSTETIRPLVTNTATAAVDVDPLSECVGIEPCQLDWNFAFANPISAHGNQKMDQTYRYGDTQNKRRETHHGVEYPNKEGVPVLAVTSGEIVFAGSDKAQKIAWVPNFYGNVVVIRHSVNGIRLPVYSLYGHLNSIAVTEGQLINAGKMIGTVGATGSAVGSHLHFEVRIGYNNYSANQNPVLWVTPGTGSGTLAGTILSEEDGFATATLNIQRVLKGVVEMAPYTSVQTYEKALLPVASNTDINENFAVGDMPVGDYRISVVFNGKIYEQFFSIVEGKLTYILIKVN